MKFESPAVHAGEEVAAQPRDQNCQRTQTTRKERNQENPPVTKTALKHPTIAHPESFEGCLKTLLEAYKRIAARGIAGILLLSAQKVLRHSRHDRPGEQIRCQHSENHCFGERHKEVPRYPRQQEHWSKYNADRKRGHEGRRRDLRRTVEH